MKALYEPHIIPDPKLPFIFHTDVLRFEPNKYSCANWHGNIEILCCINGKGDAMLDTESVRFEKGMTVVVNANVLHYVVPDDEITYKCLIIDRDFCLSNGIDTNKLHFERVMRDEELSNLFERLEYEYNRTDNDCRVAEIRLVLLKILILLRKKHTVVSGDYESIARSGNDIERIKAAILYMRNNFFQRLELDQIALSVGLSKFYLSREFKRITGQTIVEYINTYRCKYAKQLIEEGTSISDAAEACGFENMSYFSKTFKKYIGRLPSKK